MTKYPLAFSKNHLGRIRILSYILIQSKLPVWRGYCMCMSKSTMWTLILFVGFVLSGTSANNLIFYQEGESASLECSGQGDVMFWFLKGQGSAIDKIYRPRESQDVYLHDNGSLIFDNVSKKEHEGVHTCVTKFHESFQAFSVDMKVRPVYEDNLWEARYKRMFLTGLVAALVCLSLFAGFCLVHKHRYREPLQKEGGSRLVDEAYVNPAIVDDESFSSKM